MHLMKKKHVYFITIFTVFAGRWPKVILRTSSESETLKKGDKHRGILQTVITSSQFGRTV